MNETISYFSKTLEYLEGVLKKSKLENKFAEKLDEQKENLDDFRVLINKFQKDMLILDTYEAIDSDETLNKLMKIHKFITDFEWYISEISEFKDEVIKICASKREQCII